MTNTRTCQASIPSVSLKMRGSHWQWTPWTFHRCEVLQEQELCLPAAAADMSHSTAWLCVTVSSMCELHSTGKVLRAQCALTNGVRCFNLVTKSGTVGAVLECSYSGRVCLLASRGGLVRAHEWSIDYYWFIYRSVERLGRAAGERWRGDRGPVIAGISCCRNPRLSLPLVKPWESRTMVVQGAPGGTSFTVSRLHITVPLLLYHTGELRIFQGF